MGTVTKLCTIISGAPDNDLQYLKENINRESYIICADSGYKSCINAGFTPNLIIGDTSIMHHWVSLSVYTYKFLNPQLYPNTFLGSN